jgi:PAS domain S-box-containing protein
MIGDEWGLALAIVVPGDTSVTTRTTTRGRRCDVRPCDGVANDIRYLLRNGNMGSRDDTEDASDERERIRVLHVDDDPDFTELVGRFLEQSDDAIEVVTATSPEDGLRRLDSVDVDCVVSDYDMPDEDGLTFLERIRGQYPDLPFVLFTGKGSEEIASEAISAGVTEYLQKGTGSEQYSILANRIRNVVERTRSSRELARRTQRLETLISNLPGIVYRCTNDRTWSTLLVEGDCEALCGYSASELESDRVQWGEDVLHPEDEADVWQQVQSAIEADRPFEVTYRIVDADGETKWVWEQGRVVDADGDRTELEGFVTDITDRKEREVRLERSSARLSALFDNSPDMINLHDADGRLVDVNDRLCEALGYEESELLGKAVWDIDTRIDPERATELWSGMSIGDRRRLEGHYSRKDGSTFPVEVHVVRATIGGDDRFVVISRDITDRKEREKRLRRYRSLFEALHDAACIYDAEGRYELLNEPVAELYGRDAEALVGERSALVERVQATADGDPFAELVAGELDELRGEVEFGTTADSERTTEYRMSRLTVDGEFDGVACIARDVTERKAQARRLAEQNDRLEAFASVVSHDLRNPLNVAEGRLELVREDCESDHLDAVERAHDRMKDLIDDLLSLARDGSAASEATWVDLRTVANRCWANVDTMGSTLAVDGDAVVRADEPRLVQLFENLFRNAVEHGGSDVAVSVGALDDGFVVADDGSGIPETDRERAFEPGYSTRPDGTGFGLAIVRSIAEAHGWTVRATESESGGARFEVTGVGVRDD